MMPRRCNSEGSHVYWYKRRQPSGARCRTISKEPCYGAGSKKGNAARSYLKALSNCSDADVVALGLAGEP